MKRRPAAAGEAPRLAFCPFCPGHEEKTPQAVWEKKDGGSVPWAVRVVPNKFPALDSSLSPAPATAGIYDRMSGFGVHEVVIESPEHMIDFPSFSLDHAEKVVAAWVDRYRRIAADQRVRYILLFRNRGAEAGASLVHPHSQIIALPIIPKLVMEEIDGARKYYEWKERCVFCDILRDEQSQGARVIAETRGYAAFAPYASRFPYEMWLLPKRHAAHFHELAGREREFAGLLRDVLTLLDARLDRPPYNLLIHSTPCHEGELAHYHWHMEIVPRLTRIAGFEWGTGFYVNPVLPEDAVRDLVQARKDET